MVAIFDILDRTTMRAIAALRIKELREQLMYMFGEEREKVLTEVRAWQAYLDTEDN